jgi:hypothetical protein
MERRGQSSERGAVAVFLVVAAVAGALVVADMMPRRQAVVPDPPLPPVAPRAAAWTIVPESAAWRLSPESLPRLRIAVLNLGDETKTPPPARIQTSHPIVLAEGSACTAPVRPGRGCLLVLAADPLEDGLLSARLSLEGTEASVDIQAVAEGFAAQLRLEGPPVVSIPAEAPPEALYSAVAWRLSNTGLRAVRAPLSIEGAGFSFSAPACPEVIQPGEGCDVSIAFTPIAVGSTPGRLRAGAVSAALLGVVPDDMARAAVVSIPTAEGWETELRNVGSLAFVAPAAEASGGALVQADGCAGRPLDPGAACRVRLSGAGAVRFRTPLGWSVSWSP